MLIHLHIDHSGKGVTASRALFRGATVDKMRREWKLGSSTVTFGRAMEHKKYVPDAPLGIFDTENPDDMFAMVNITSHVKDELFKQNLPTAAVR